MANDGRSCMRSAGIWNLPLALSICFGFASYAEGDTGYKGIPWGTACGEAIKGMEAKGFVFNHKETLGSRGARSSPSQPHLFLSNPDRRASCSAENADLELDTKEANPYSQHESVSGDITITLLCRAGTFVGARVETGINNTAAAEMLTQAAGPPVRTVRADTCGDLYWKCTADHSMLRARGDAVRYLERPVRSSRDFDGRGPPPLRYLILAQSEDRALQTAYRACVSKRLAGDRLEKKRIADGNRAAVE
jgi:hypothetical protein